MLLFHVTVIMKFLFRLCIPIFPPTFSPIACPQALVVMADALMDIINIDLHLLIRPGREQQQPKQNLLLCSDCLPIIIFITDCPVFFSLAKVLVRNLNCLTHGGLCENLCVLLKGCCGPFKERQIGINHTREGIGREPAGQVEGD
jgi:hypothetical protein